MTDLIKIHLNHYHISSMITIAKSYKNNDTYENNNSLTTLQFTSLNQNKYIVYHEK